MKIHHAIAIAATLLGGAAVLPTVPTAEAGTSKALAQVKNDSAKAVTCTVHRDNDGNKIATINTDAKASRTHSFVVPADKPLMYLMCPGGPQGAPTKMRTKLDGKKIDSQAWSVECYNTGTCVANVRSVQRA